MQLFERAHHLNNKLAIPRPAARPPLPSKPSTVPTKVTTATAATVAASKPCLEGDDMWRPVSRGIKKELNMRRKRQGLSGVGGRRRIGRKQRK